MFIDPHTHMISRTTDDYEAMARAGVVAVIEPAFWLGQPRTHVGSYIDYLSHIVGFERFRAGQFGMRHYCTIGLNSKEANNEALAEAVMEILPRFAPKEGVVAIGEIGYDEQTELEDKYFRAPARARPGARPAGDGPHAASRQEARHLALHGRDPGARARPARVVIDHNNEETVREVLDRGFWAAFSIYPHTKMGNERMVEIVRAYGPSGSSSTRLRLGHVRSARRAEDGGADRRARHSGGRHPPAHLRQRARRLRPERADARRGLARAGAIDQRTLYQGNSVLRGGPDAEGRDRRGTRRVICRR